MQKTDALVRLQDWYLAQCNGGWEHTYGVFLNSVDNPGWHLRVQLSGTDLMHRDFKKVRIQRDDERDWLVCEVAEHEFVGYCGPKNLTEMLEAFLAWAESTAQGDATSELTSIYHDYIACLNQQDWGNLSRFVHQAVSRNDTRLGLAGYRKMLEQDFAEIPDLSFAIELAVAEPPYLASRLRFNCSPVGRFLNLSVNGRKVSFAENVFYEFLDRKIIRVWSVIDKLAIEAQLPPQSDSKC